MNSSRRIGVIGSTGQLGSDVVQVLMEAGRYMVAPLRHEQLDVTNRESAAAVIREGQFDVVINCAAFHKVEECEARPDEALGVNALGALNVAKACAAVDALCVFISTDYVFGGSGIGPYTEDHLPAPVNAYGVSKVAGELFVQQGCPRWLVLRIASVFGKAGARGKGGNFIEAILGKARAGGPVRVVNDIWMSPTYTIDAARTLEQLLTADATGVFHAANTGRCTWYDLASEAVRAVGLSLDVEPITSGAYPSTVRRPGDSSLSSVRLPHVLGHELRPWQDALGAYLLEKGYIQG